MKSSMAMETILLALLVSEIGFCQKKHNEYRGRTGEALNYQLVEVTKWEANVKEVKIGPSIPTNAGYPKLTILANTLSRRRQLGGQLRFHDENGNVTYTKELGADSRIYLESENGNFVLVETLLRVATKEEPGLRRLELIDSRGTSNWLKDEEILYDGDGFRYCLANDGTSVTILQSAGLLTFLDRSGNQINQVDIFAKDIWSRGRIVMGKYSTDSRYFVVNACDDVGNTFSKQSGIICFDNQGHEIWRYHAEEKRPGSVWISPTNQYVIAYNRTFQDGNFANVSTYLLNFQGMLMRRFEEITNDVRFTSENDHALFIIDAQRGIQLVDLKSGSIEFEERTIGKVDSKGNPNKILAADANDMKKLICLLKNEEIIVMHLNHVTAWSKAIDPNETNRSHINPTVQFSNDAQELVVYLNSGIFKYRLTE